MDTSHGQQALVFDFDTIQQLELWDLASGNASSWSEFPPPLVTHRFSGLLRTADVLTTTIVLPDVQLLDGALFLHHGPDVVKSLLGRSLHESMDIKIVGRDESLAECLRKMVLGSRESRTLATFEFSSMTVMGLNARDLAQKVSRRPSTRLKHCQVQEIAQVVAAEFQAAWEGLPNSEVIDTPTGIFMVLANRWEDWIRAVTATPGTLTRWIPERFRLEPTSTPQFVPEEVNFFIETHDQGAHIVDELRGIKGRSSLKARLEQLKAELPAGTVDSLDAWWSSAYFDALARQHQCSWLRLQSTDVQAADMAASRAPGTVSVQFEGNLIEILSEMPSPAYASAKYSSRKAINKWAESPVAANSDGLAFAILKFSETLDRRETRSKLWRQVILTLVPAILGAAIGHYVSTVAGIWALALTAVTILLAAPIEDLLELHAMRRKKMQSVINMPGGLRV